LEKRGLALQFGQDEGGAAGGDARRVVAGFDIGERQWAGQCDQFEASPASASPSRREGGLVAITLLKDAATHGLRRRRA
jgi:hypothetical protein